MSSSITATFDTRREADMAIERLVQEFGVERTDIFVATEGDDNSAGDVPAGSDNEGAELGSPSRDDGAYHGRVAVSVDVNNEGRRDKIIAAFDEFNGTVDEA